MKNAPKSNGKVVSLKSDMCACGSVLSTSHITRRDKIHPTRTRFGADPEFEELACAPFLVYSVHMKIVI
jgi:hypothetical protein